MEANLIQQKKTLLTKIPDIRNALESLKYLIKKQVNCFLSLRQPVALTQRMQEAKESISTHFELADNLHAKATISDASTVLLWLGVFSNVNFSAFLSVLFSLRQMSWWSIRTLKRSNY